MTNQTELTAERIEEAAQYYEGLIQDDIKERMVNDTTHKNRKTALAAIRAEQERQWISVEDRLPNMCGCKCLVAAINQFGQKDVFTAFTGYMEHGKLEFHSCEPTHEITAWTITHWMPLPKPPKEADHANELKPCPFCGSKAVISELEEDLYLVRCTLVGCPAMEGATAGSVDEAKSVWNRRTADEPD